MAEERGGAEARRHFRGARFIMEAGLRLGLGSAALSTALGAFLRFAREHRSPYDPALVAAAALLLAGKAQGAGPRARDVINVTHRCLHPGHPPPAPGPAVVLRRSVGRFELLLLRTLRFRLALPQPHRKVAVSALLLAMELCGCGAPPGAPPGWWKVLSPGLRAAEVAQILRALLDLYGNDCSAGGAPLRPTAPPSAPHFRSSPRPASPPPAPRTEPRRRHVVPSHQ